MSYIVGKIYYHKLLSTISNKIVCWLESWEEKSEETAHGCPYYDISDQYWYTNYSSSSLFLYDAYSGWTYFKHFKPI